MDTTNITVGEGVGRLGMITTDHAASSYGIPVIIIDGEVYGPDDLIEIGEYTSRIRDCHMHVTLPPHEHPSNEYGFPEMEDCPGCATERAERAEIQNLISIFKAC